MSPPSGSLPFTAVDITAEDLARLAEYRLRLDSITATIKDSGLMAARDQLRDVTNNAKEFREEFLKSVDSTKKYFSELSNEMDTLAQNIQTRFRELQNESKVNAKKIEELGGQINGAFALTPEQKRALEESLEEIKKTTGKSAEEVATKMLEPKRAIQALIDSLSNLNEETIKQDFITRLRQIADGTLEATAGAEADFVNSLGATVEERALAIYNLKKEDIGASDALSEYIDLLTTEMNIRKDGLRTQLNQIDADKQANFESEKKNELLKKELELSAPLVKMEQLHAKSLKDVGESMSGVVDKMVSASSSTNAFGAALTAALTHPEGGIKGINNLSVAVTEGLAGSFLKPELAANRLFNFLNDKLIKSTFEFNKISAEVNRQTGGFGDRFKDVAFQRGSYMGADAFKQSDLAVYGLTLKEFATTYGSLSKTIGNFNNLLDNQRELLTRNAAALSMLGVSAETYGSLTNTFMGALGKSTEQVGEIMNSVSRDALGLGRSVADYTTKLEQSMRNLVGYGREATEIFRQLAAVSQATSNKISETDLLALSDKFKTFDVAAQSVSNLNAVMRGYSVDLMAIMRADPAERMIKLKKATEDANLQFENLNYGYKSLLAETFFGGDISKAEAFFNTPLAKMNEELAKGAASQKELQQRKEASANAQDRLNAALESMKIALTPITNFVDKIARGFIKLNEMGGSFTTFIVGFGILLAPVAAAFIGLRRAMIAPFNELRIMLREIKAELVQIASISATVRPGMTQGQYVASQMGTYDANVAAATKTAKFSGRGIGLALGGLAVLGTLAAMGSSDSERKKVDDGIVVSSRGKISTTEIREDDDVTAFIGKPNGPVSTQTNFLGNSSNVSYENTTNQSFLHGLLSPSSPIVSSLEKLTNFISSTNTKNETQLSSVMNANQQITEAVQTNNSNLQSAAMQQTLISSNYSSAPNYSSNETVNVVGGMSKASGGMSGPMSLVAPDGTELKMNVTLNANFTKLVEVLSEEVFAKLRSKV
jgi:hypothetical protein